MRKLIVTLFGSLLWLTAASAQTIVGPLPFTLQNGSIADANQVMSNFNAIAAAVNANAAAAGANSNITALNGLTTPLVLTSGGTATYIGGTSGGSANAQTVVSPIPGGFTLLTGKSVVFQAGFTNTGPTTLAVAGTTATNVFKQGPSGPVALSGGEIAVGNLVWAIFDGTEYQIGNVSPTSLVPACTVIDWTGANGPPSGYLFMGGQAVSRTTFATLFNCIAVQGVAATTASGSSTIAVPNSALFQGGWFVGGNNVPCNSTVVSAPDGAHIGISANASGNGATTLTIGPYPQGDCSTTFNVGNFQGRATMARDQSSLILTSATCPGNVNIGTICGSQLQTLTLAQLPTGITASGNNAISVTSAASNVITGTLGVVVVGSGGQNVDALTIGAGSGAITSSGTNSIAVTSNNTSGAAHPILPPVVLVDKYIKF